MIFFDTTNLKNDKIYLSLIKTDEAVPEKKRVPDYQFDICLSDGTKIGYCNLRIDNSELTKFCGNIGYGINENYRGHKYSALAVELLIKLAKKHGLKYVLITCSPDNTASNKICEFLNAEFVETVDVPPIHEMYPEHKKLNIYRIKL